jgi:glutathione peroxidase
MTRFHDFQVTGLLGDPDLLKATLGKVVLVVNVASECGLTPQYAGLERLYQELKNHDFMVIGFPCNQFGGQEPGTEQQIQEFCSRRYGVSFPLSAKLEVNGASRHPLYAWLTDRENGYPGNIEWNFEKFLIGRDGALLMRYPPSMPPEDKGLMHDIADALDV